MSLTLQNERNDEMQLIKYQTGGRTMEQTKPYGERPKERTRPYCISEKDIFRKFSSHSKQAETKPQETPKSIDAVLATLRGQQGPGVEEYLSKGLPSASQSTTPTIETPQAKVTSPHEGFSEDTREIYARWETQFAGTAKTQ